MSKITIIIPIYNVNEDYFKKCMKSVLNQTLKDIEVILVDDGSKKNIGLLCDKYAKLDIRIKVLHQLNQGVSVARNNGLQHAKSQWVMFVDADDWIENDACEKLYKYTNESYDVIVGRAYEYINDRARETFYKGNKVNYVLKKEDKENLIKMILIDKDLKYSYVAVPWARLYKLDTIKKNNIEFKKGIMYGEDALFNIELFIKFNSVFVDELIYYYRINEESITHTFKYEILDSLELLYKNLILCIYDLNKNKELEESIYYFKIKHLNKVLDNYYKINNDVKFIPYIMKNFSYIEAVKNIKVRKLPKTRKILIILIRLKLFCLIKCMYKVKLYINKMREKKYALN